jgi:hypothetical protein
VNIVKNGKPSEIALACRLFSPLPFLIVLGQASRTRFDQSGLTIFSGNPVGNNPTSCFNMLIDTK